MALLNPLHMRPLGFAVLSAAIALGGVASGIAQSGTSAPYDIEVISHDTPKQLGAGDRVTVRIELRNAGAKAWAPDDHFNLSYLWLPEDSETVVPKGLRTPFPRTVAVGETIEMEASLGAPKLPGRYLLQWDVVHERVTWASTHDPTPMPPFLVTVGEAPPTYALTVLSHDTPRWMWANSTRPVSLEVRNDGTETWDPIRPISLSYHWWRPQQEPSTAGGLRSAMEHTAAPGNVVRIQATLRAPSAVGRHLLRWDMVEENVRWFKQRDPSPEPAISVIVLPTVSVVYLGFLVLLPLTALAIGATVWHPRAPGWALVAIARADVLWLLASLFGKQWAVFENPLVHPAQGLSWATFTGVAVIALVVLAVPRKIGWIAAWLVVATASFVIFADVVYLRFFGDVISVSAFGAAGQTGMVGDSILSLVTVADVWLFADLLASVPLLLLVRRLPNAADRRPTVVLALILLPLLIPGAITLRTILQAPRGPFANVFRNTFQVQAIGILNYHAHDLVEQIKGSGLKKLLDADDRRRIEDWYRDHRAERAGTEPWFAAAEGMNLLMVQVESMQGFVIGLEVGGQEITPNLNRWRRQALWFSRVTDQAAQGRTSDAEFSTQLSLLPAQVGAAAFRYSNNRYTGLAEILHHRGYETLSAVPFESAFWNRRVMHPAFGYRTTLFESSFEPAVQVGWGLNDADFLRQMTPRLTSMSEPFCAYLITLSNHHPYSSFPDQLKELDLGKWEGTSFGNYLHSMNFFDRGLGKFIGELSQTGLLGRTVVALWGDHNAGFKWRPEIAGAVDLPYSHAASFVFKTVPLMINVPGAADLRGERTIRCGQVDVAPTLLALLGIDPGAYAFLGRNLLGKPGPGPVLRRHGTWLSDSHLFIEGGPQFEEGRCFELQTLDRVSVDACRELNGHLQEQVEVAEATLVYDLQVELGEGLR